jgi:hypothetical protein
LFARLLRENRSNDKAIHLSNRHSGRREAAIRNLEIPGLMLRIAPE